MRREEVAAREFLLNMRRQWMQRQADPTVPCPIQTWEHQSSADRGALIAAMTGALKAVEPEAMAARLRREAEREMEDAAARAMNEAD